MRRGHPCQTLREDPRNTNNRVSAGKSQHLTFCSLKNTGGGCTKTQTQAQPQERAGPDAVRAVAPGQRAQEEARKSLQFSSRCSARGGSRAGRLPADGRLGRRWPLPAGGRLPCTQVRPQQMVGSGSRAWAELTRSTLASRSKVQVREVSQEMHRTLLLPPPLL